MNMKTLFSTLSEVENQIEQADAANDVAFLNMLDEKYESAWQDIFQHKPQNDLDAERMLQNLLDIMCQTAAQGGSVVQIREKIVELFEMQSVSSHVFVRSNDISMAEPAHA